MTDLTRETYDHTYKALVEHILKHGNTRPSRPGIDTVSVFGVSYEVDLMGGEVFPLLTLKKTHFKSVAEELFWFMRGSTDNNDLEAHGCTIWREWADETGNLGPIYGAQMRRWEENITEDCSPEEYLEHDQLKGVITSIKTNPHSRRHIISMWNVSRLPIETKNPQWNVAAGYMALAPCHVLYQFYVVGDKLDLMVTQRSLDVFLGLPFNTASFALFLSIIATVTGYKPGKLHHHIGDAHLYTNHMAQVNELLSRDPNLKFEAYKGYSSPRVTVAEDINPFNPLLEKVELVDYYPHPAIKADVAV